MQYDKRIIYEAKELAKVRGIAQAYEDLGGGSRYFGIDLILQLLRAIPLDTLEVEAAYYAAYREQIPNAYLSSREDTIRQKLANRKAQQ